MKRVTYSFGCTPERVLRKRITEPYSMSLVGADADVATKIVNVGIDSRLTAVTFADEPEWSGHRLNLNITPDGMLVFLRRLFEGTGLDDSGDEGSEIDTAWSLRSSILETLGIEEI